MKKIESRKTQGRWPWTAGCLSLLLTIVAIPTVGAARPMRLEAIDRSPQENGATLTAERLAKLKAGVAEAPKDRSRRFALVRGLMSSGQLEEALAEARKWRQIDAYNLVAVRLIGDILTELGRAEEALRVYSAVVELLPEDAQAQRALATVLKQSGQIAGAYDRLVQASARRPDDRRIRFELADTAHRLGRAEEAEQLFLGIVSDSKSAKSVAYPSKQRLAQIWAAKRIAALKEHDETTAKKWASKVAGLKVKGGAENDIKVYLTWDTDGSDVDLWVTNPAGERVFYSRKRGRFGGALFHDVTRGYGPESFTATQARHGTYLIQVNYFSTNRSAFSEARGEVTVVINEGRADEVQHVLPYRLFRSKQTVDVARIVVGGAS